MKILVDSRERIPLKFSEQEIVTLKTGDYSLPGHTNKISFDRKSPQDLFSTLGSGHKRFKKELERASTFDYFCIIIEAPYDTIKYKTFRGSKFSQMPGSTVIKILHTLELKYGIKVVYCSSRHEMREYIIDCFESYLKLQNN